MGSRGRDRKRSSDAEVIPDDDDSAVSPPDRRKQRREPENDKENRANGAASAAVGAPVRRINAPGKPPEAGIIQRIHVENFMCHKKFSVNLCRNVNFIHGQNGSGKSAILAAIQICLGAGARRTHRARNLKDLIRKETNSNCAKVRVTLLNKGGDGFQPEIYGDTITVERTISKGGGYNGYKLLDHDGVEKSRKKQDLDLMLDQLNIQVENPVAVMDQEESKKFLTGKPEDKYQFFHKATELERLDHTYQSIVDNIQELTEGSARVKATLHDATEKVRQLKHELKQFQELENLEEKVMEHQEDYAWALFNEYDDQFQQLQDIITTLQAKCEKRRADLLNAQEKSASGSDEEQEKQAAMQLLTEEAQQAAAAKTDLEAELKRAKVPVKTKERELQGLTRDLRNAVKEFEKVKAFLQETRDKILAAAGSAKSDEAKRTQKLQQAEKDLEEARAESLQLRQTISESLRKYEDMEPNVAQAKNNTSALAKQKAAVGYKIRDLEKAGDDSLLVFGKKCAKVHQLVEAARRNRKFRGKVVGPIGAHIKVAPGKEKFSQIAELALGGGLDRFIVTNHDDRQVMMKIRRDAGCSAQECGITQVKDVARFRVPPPPARGIETVASVLQVTDDLVFNTLVDTSNIDQLALAESKQVSEQALLVEGANHTYSIRGGNLRKVYFMPQGDHWSINKRGARTIMSNERSFRQTIGVDRSRAIADAKQEHVQLSREVEECKAKETDLNKQYHEYKVQWNNANKAARANSKLVEKLTNSIEELQAEANDAEENDAVDTTELEEDVSNAEHNVRTLETQREEVAQEIEEMSPGITEIEKRLEEVSARNQKVLTDLEQAEVDLQQYYNTLSQRRAQADKKATKLQQTEAMLADHEKKLRDITEDHEKSLRKARCFSYDRELKLKRKERTSHAEDGDTDMPLSSQEEVSDPPDEVLEAIKPKRTRKERSYYQARIEKAKRRIAEERERRSLSDVDPDEVYENYRNAKEALQAKTQEIANIDENIAQLTEDTKERKKRWRQWRGHIEDMTNVTFDEMLQKKGSAGNLEFDHNSKTLDLSVQKDNMNDMSQTSDVKALSGGERSFTTLSLLLALGEQLETPFRVMDEFDVFMDNMSRTIALTQLVNVSKSMEHRQFIFITPQDLSFLQADPMLKIIKMKPPARSANVGGPQQQTLD